MISIGQLAEWIVVHRRGKAFEGYSFEKIIAQLNECAKNLSMLCVTDDHEDIVGIICCSKDKERKELYVNDILTVKSGVVKQMMKYFMATHKGWTIHGRHRTGRLRHFIKPERLEQLL